MRVDANIILPKLTDTMLSGRGHYDNDSNNTQETLAMTKNAINCFEIPVKDLDRVVDFYENMLQLQLQRDSMEVSVRTIYRDVQDLSLSGVPVIAETGTGYRLDKSYNLPPLTFSETELEYRREDGEFSSRIVRPLGLSSGPMCGHWSRGVNYATTTGNSA